MSSAAHPVLAALRQRLGERFPTALRPAAEGWGAELSVLTAAVPDGLPRGAMTELVAPAASAGCQTLLGLLAAAAAAERQRVAWIDGHDSFDPGAWPAEMLASLIWARCPGAAEALQVADILARDANLGLLILDLRDAAPGELRRLPATAWYRLQRAVEATGQVFLVASLQATVPSTRLRLQLEGSHDLGALTVPRPTLAAHLSLSVTRQRVVTPFRASA